MASPESLRNAKGKWIKEIRRYTDSPVLLVGTKADLRDETDPAFLPSEFHQSKKLDFAVAVTQEEGQEMAAECGAMGFVD